MKQLTNVQRDTESHMAQLEAATQKFEDWTPDEQLINQALLRASLDSESCKPVRHLSGLDSYLNHVRAALLPVLEQVRADVKAACPSVPSTEKSPLAILEKIRDTARSSLKPDVYPDEESWQRSRLREIESLAVGALK